MSSLVSALWGVISAPPAPLALLIYEEDLSKNAVIAEIESLVPEGVKVLVSKDVADAFSKPQPLLLLVPEGDEAEAAALNTLAARRDSLLDRKQSAILFLLRGGMGTNLLKTEDMAGLWSWVANQILEPRALRAVDTKEERRQFLAETGRSPEDWLISWRAGMLPDTLDNTLYFHRAFLISESDGRQN